MTAMLDKNEILKIPDGELELDSCFLSPSKSDDYFEYLHEHTPWSQRLLRIHGKEIPMPRLIAWYGDQGIDYHYSGGHSPRQDWNSVLLEIKEQIENHAQLSFNGVLLNLYRDGQDSMGWHSDNEASLGENPVVASLSLGASREFQMQHKTRKNLKYKIELAHGSLLIMRDSTQQYWRHQLAKDAQVAEPRINLTFRKIIK